MIKHSEINYGRIIQLHSFDLNYISNVYLLFEQILNFICKLMKTCYILFFCGIFK